MAKRPKIEDLNLIPLMNLFVTMIPLLLLTAAFYHIGMVSVSVPTQSEEESDVAAGKASVTMNIQIDKKGYSLTASSGQVFFHDGSRIRALGLKSGEEAWVSEPHRITKDPKITKPYRYPMSG